MQRLLHSVQLMDVDLDVDVEVPMCILMCTGVPMCVLVYTGGADACPDVYGGCRCVLVSWFMMQKGASLRPLRAAQHPMKLA